jgi:hypothetical protein
MGPSATQRLMCGRHQTREFRTPRSRRSSTSKARGGMVVHADSGERMAGCYSWSRFQATRSRGPDRPNERRDGSAGSVVHLLAIRSAPLLPADRIHPRGATASNPPSPVLDYQSGAATPRSAAPTMLASERCPRPNRPVGAGQLATAPSARRAGTVSAGDSWAGRR